jgi:hypothetical protein
MAYLLKSDNLKFHSEGDVSRPQIESIQVRLTSSRLEKDQIWT